MAVLFCPLDAGSAIAFKTREKFVKIFPPEESGRTNWCCFDAAAIAGFNGLKKIFDRIDLNAPGVVTLRLPSTLRQAQGNAAQDRSLRVT
jgi:hypothetical protein